MRKVISILAVVAAVTVVVAARPVDIPIDDTSFDQSNIPRAAACVISIGRGTTGVIANAGGVSAAVAGEKPDRPVIPIGEVTPSGVGVALVEFSGLGGAAVVSSDGIGSMAANCTQTVRDPIALTAFSTRNDRAVELVVANPYALDAVIDVSTISEVGADTSEDLESIVVPAGATVVRDLGRLLPLRNHLSIILTARQGSVHAVVSETNPTDTRVSEGVAGSDEWWVILPPLPVSADITVVSTVFGSIPFQMDFWSPDGLVEAAIDDAIPSGGQVGVGSEELGNAQAVRIIAANPIVAGVSFEGEHYLGGGPAARGLAFRWVAAGAGAAAPATIWVFNPNPEPATLRVDPVDSGRSFTVEVGAGALTPVEVGLSNAGFMVEADGPVAVIWTAIGPGLSYSAGIPLDG